MSDRTSMNATQQQVQMAANLYDHAQPAREPMTRGWRLLNKGELIESGDELMEDDCVTWSPLVGWEVGIAYNPTLHVPIRRCITAQAGEVT